MRKISEIHEDEVINKGEEITYSPSIVAAAEIALAKQLSTIASSATRGQGVVKIATKGIKTLLEEESHAALATYLRRFKYLEINALDADECDGLEDTYAASNTAYESEGEDALLKMIDEESEDGTPSQEDGVSEDDFDSDVEDDFLEEEGYPEEEDNSDYPAE